MGRERVPGNIWDAGLLCGGLIGISVLFVALALLFAGRYPRGLFDLVLGLNRWVLRVVAYAALITDVYPPFRLDQGGADGPTSPTPIDVAPSTGATARAPAAPIG